MQSAIRVLGQDNEDILPEGILKAAGSGFELLRLSTAYPGDIQADIVSVAKAKLQTATVLFNGMPRKHRKLILPAFLIIGLSKKHAQNINKSRSLFFYQLHLLKMALCGKL